MNLIILIAFVGFVGLFSNAVLVEGASKNLEYPDFYPSYPEYKLLERVVIDWQIIYVTSSATCSQNEKNEALWLSQIAIWSFYQYDFHDFGNWRTSTTPDCISINEFTGKLTDYQRLLDIPIFVLGKELTKLQVDSTGEGGHYATTDKNIVAQAGSDQNFSAWSLSHEIAHFSLDHLGYSDDIMVDSVHELEDAFRECTAQGDNYEINLSSCQTLWVSVETIYGESVIMSPQLIFEDIYKREREQQLELDEIKRLELKKIAEWNRQSDLYEAEKLRSGKTLDNEKQERLRIYQEKFELQLIEDERQKQLEDEKQKQKTPIMCGAGTILNNENKCVQKDWWTNLMTWLGFF